MKGTDNMNMILLVFLTIPSYYPVFRTDNTYDDQEAK